MEYRALTIGALGNIIERRTFEAADDSAAMARAREHLKDREIEVWSGDRKVGSLAAKSRP
jgi:hypothetical protein